MQPFRAATECEVDRARKRAASCNRAQTSDTEQILEICGCHFLMKTLPRVASEMALHVLAYNLTRVMNIMGIQPLTAAIGA